MLNILFPNHRIQQHYNAISDSHALIWFTTDGVIAGANANFCRALGYSAAEIVGKHHRIFVEQSVQEKPEYGQFWRDLAAGKMQKGQFRRITKTGQDVWIEASYDPVKEGDKVVGVVKIATDITATKLASMHNENLLRALERSVAVIEFEPDGTIVEANVAFCSVMGYSRDEIVGKKHSMFCDQSYAQSPDYTEFWTMLRRGEFFSDSFQRIGKNGREVWIQATYNPVFSSRGAIYRIVKFATDVTERMRSVAVLSTAIGELADGNLTARVEQPLDKSMETTKTDLNSALDKLNLVIGDIAQTSSDIAVTAGELQDSSGSIAKRTEQQAAALEQTAAALEQITQTVNDASLRASEAGDLVRETGWCAMPWPPWARSKRPRPRSRPSSA
jgi:methyl-accepting chemotaxis protein